jgi:hypothetical protein
MKIKIYECKICRKLYDSSIKGIERFYGTRKDVRHHLVVEHHLKHVKNTQGVSKKNFGQSEITENTLAIPWEDFK